jgi:hypothetical protein
MSRMSTRAPGGQGPLPSARPYTTTALPSTSARLLAFVAILVAGLCGGLIGWSVTDLQCGSEDRPALRSSLSTTTTSANSITAVGPDTGTGVDHGCATWSAVGGFVGAVTGAGGVGIVSVLVLRAMAEWRRNLEVEELPRRSTNGTPPT